jgi:hypothetical protein
VPVTDAAVSRPSARVSAPRPSAAASPRPKRRRRLAAVAVLSVVAALTLSACDNAARPGTAAAVGDQRITDGNLQDMVNESLNSPGVRAALPTSDYKGDLGAYRRAVLNVEVERLLAESGAQKLGIGIDENAVDARYKFFEDQSGGAGSFASELASRLAVSPTLYRQLVRTEVIESEIGYTEGGVKRPTDAELQALYQQYLPTAISATLSLIQVPDQATANQAAAAIRRAPNSFATVAARYTGSGSQTAPDPQKYVLSQLPQDLAATLAKTPNNTVFPYVLANGAAKAYFVIRFGAINRPTLESARPQLEAQTLQQAAAAGQKYLQQVALDQGVTVNPRYGTWKADQLAITDFVNPVIKPTPSPAASSGSVLPGDGTTGDGTTGGTGADPGTGATPVPTPSG